MAYTRTQQTAIMDHLLQSILGETADGPIEQSLNQNGFDTIQSFATMGRDEIRLL
jgi:hypothetical protein